MSCYKWLTLLSAGDNHNHMLLQDIMHAAGTARFDSGKSSSMSYHTELLGTQLQSHLGAGHVWGHHIDALLTKSRVGCIIDSSWPLVFDEEVEVNITCSLPFVEWLPDDTVTTSSFCQVTVAMPPAAARTFKCKRNAIVANGCGWIHALLAHSKCQMLCRMLLWGKSCSEAHTLHRLVVQCLIPNQF